MAATEHKEHKELLTKRGDVRSTSRGTADYLAFARCGWVYDHSRAPLRSLAVK
jgi:hypothetical protein